jgi:hypothetical protein
MISKKEACGCTCGRECPIGAKIIINPNAMYCETCQNCIREELIEKYPNMFEK